MESDDLKRRLELAVAIAREAGALTLKYFGGQNYAVELKPDNTPVTVADRQAEELLRARIAAGFPQDGLLGEEFGEQAGTSGYRWILDPIDGTKSFVCGVPLYGTLIGVERLAAGGAPGLERTQGGESLVGVVYMPALNELAYAAKGQGCWHAIGDSPPRPGRVSGKRRLADSLFCTSDVRGYETNHRLSAYERLQAASWLTRTWGDCYGYVLVATGRAELMIDPQMNVWDCAAVQPILQEAGGTFTDWQGNPTIHSKEAIATNGHVAQEVLAVTREYPRQAGPGGR